MLINWHVHATYPYKQTFIRIFKIKDCRCWSKVKNWPNLLHKSDFDSYSGFGSCWYDFIWIKLRVKLTRGVQYFPLFCREWKLVLENVPNDSNHPTKHKNPNGKTANHLTLWTLKSTIETSMWNSSKMAAVVTNQILVNFLPTNDILAQQMNSGRRI